MEKIDWKALGFDFSEDSPLQVLIDQMNGVIDASNDMAKTLVNNNKKIASQMEGQKNEALQLADSIKKVNVESAASSKVLSDASKKTAELTASTKTLTLVEVENDTIIAKLKKEVESLTAAKKKLEDANKNEIGSINDLKKKLGDAESSYRKMGDATRSDDKIKQAKEVQELSKQYSTATKALNDARKATVVISGSYQELTQKVAAAKSELKLMGDGFDKNNPKVQALTKYIKTGSDRLKEFDKALGDNQREVGNYGLAMKGLDSASGGAASQISNLGAEFSKLATNPWVLAATVLIGAFLALKNAAESYYHATLAGEEQLSEFKARNEAFFSTYVAGWNEVGGAAVDYFEKFIAFHVKAFQIMFQSNETTRIQVQLEKDLLAIERERASLQKEHLRDMVDDANTELKVTKLLEISKNKADFTAKERIEALHKGNDLLREQEEGDIVLAKRDLQLQKDIIAEQSKVNDGVFDRLKSISEMSDEEILGIKVKGEEVAKLAQFETALIKVESDASSKRVSRLKQEVSLLQEIKKDETDAAEAAEQRADNKKALEIAMKRLSEADHLKDIQLMVTKDLVDEEVKIRKKGLDRMISDLEAMNEKTTQLKEEQAAKDAQIQAARAALEQQAFTTSQALIDNFFNAEDMRLQARTANVQLAMAEELKHAGTNADAKAAIESRYAEELAKIQQEQRENKRKQAIADKAFSAFQIVIKTAQAIAEAVAASPLTAGLPFTAIISAIGALQLAAVISQPIPQFEKGTESSPEGVAVVAEKGKRELGVDRSGHATLYDTENADGMLTYLKGGTKIYNNDETEKILEGEQFFQAGRAFSGMKRSLHKKGASRTTIIQVDNSEIVQELRRNKPHNVVRIANDIYDVKELNNGSKQYIRSLSMGR